MNKLPVAKRVQILSMLCEGSSMRSISRVVDVSINTVSKLLEDAGKACADFHDANMRGVDAKRIQCDEIWSFCYAKAKNVATAKAAPDDAGDMWTWTALDADSKLIVSYLVGGRDAGYAKAFVLDLAGRLTSRVQLTTDGHKAYLEAVEGAFGADVDYAMLVKLYGPAPGGTTGRYSPAECTGIKNPHRRLARRGARLNLLRRAPEPDDADADEAIHAPLKRVLEKVRKPCSHGRALYGLVQLREDAQ